jgi:uncharacterized membrane protein
MNSKAGQHGRLTRIWLKFLIVPILITGIFFRFTNLDRKVYSYDESITSLRISGYTWTEMVQQDFQGKPVSASYLLAKYQQINTEKSLFYTVKGLATEEPQLPPLYFILARFWAQLFGPTVGAVRSLSAWISLLVFPSVYWLCWELFQSTSVGWMAVAIMAVSPFHVLYAQEARPYMLFTVIVLLSSALLLRAIALTSSPVSSKFTPVAWCLYAIAITFGLYTNLLFSLVSIAHTVYIIIIDKLRFSKKTIVFLLSATGGTICFLPWILVLVVNAIQVDKTVGFPHLSLSFLSLLKPLILITCRLFIDTHWAGGIIDFGVRNRLTDLIRIIVVGLLLSTIAYSIYWLCYCTPKRVWLFVLSAIGITAIVLIAVKGIADRYTIAYILGIQLAVAHLFATKILVAANNRKKNLWKVGFIALISMQIISCTVSSQSQLWWNKYPSSTKYNPAIAKIVNQSQKPLIISHGGNNITGKILSLSYLLKPQVQFLLVTKPSLVKIPEGFSDVFLYRATDSLLFELEKVQNYQIQPIYKPGDVWLWRLEK